MSSTCCIAYYAFILCRKILRRIWLHYSKGKWTLIKHIYQTNILAGEWRLQFKNLIYFLFISTTMFSTLLSKVSHNSGGFVLVLFFQWWPFLVIPTIWVINGEPGSHSPHSGYCTARQNSIFNVHEESHLETGSQEVLSLFDPKLSLKWKEAACKTWWSLPFSLAASPLCLFFLLLHTAGNMEAGAQQGSTAWMQRSGREGEKMESED